jgi:hypothetical protein
VLATLEAAALLSAAAAAAIACLWLLIPAEINPAEILPAAVNFLDAQRSGSALSAAAAAAYPWLNASGTADAVPGGFYMGADYVKYGPPVASSMALLAWSVVEFGQGYEQVGACISEMFEMDFLQDSAVVCRY